jgi:branched-chain amino acid transport system ATP-binding protein
MKLSKNFGGVAAVKDLDLAVNEGEIFALIGPNGAGKSTVFSMLCGFQQPTYGRVVFHERDITGMPAHEVAQLGIARVFQHNVIFGKLSVMENVFIGCHKAYQTSQWRRVLRTPQARSEERLLRESAGEALDLVGLTEFKDELASSLPHGLQRALSVAIAMATRPSLLLLDEPVTGMNPSESRSITALVRRIRDNLGVTIMLVEHNMKVVMDVSDRVLVINFGERLCEGSAEYVSSHPDVCEAYLGAGSHVS